MKSMTPPLLEVSVQEADFDVGHEVARLTRHDAGAGAVASFIGLVRGRDSASPSPLGLDQALELEHYPGMTEQSLRHMAEHAAQRFGLRGVRIVHRVGRLPLGAQIVLVVVSSAHRLAAFEGCEFLMDWLKTQAPFWKKEHQGSQAEWVDAREHDDLALQRWGSVPGGRSNADPSQGAE